MPDASSPAGLAEILQMCCLSRRSGQINFRAGGSSGFVYLLHGKVTHALCGSLEGEEAVYRMLNWGPGGYALSEDVLPQDTTIIMTWEQLLLEAARRADQGIDTPPLPSAPVVTTAPVTSTRVKASLPKITLTLPGERPRVYELEAEYTHVGRASGNEVPLADPSVSNRHCIFILHGADVVLRDLNSSNGTVVNGKPISEVVLRPGDLIQVGVVEMKFEPAVRRPKLTQALPEATAEDTTRELPARFTAKTVVNLPTPTPLPSEPAEVKDDSAFVKGESAISYRNLAKPEEPAKSNPVLLLIVGIAILFALLAGGYYYFFYLHAR